MMKRKKEKKKRIIPDKKMTESHPSSITNDKKGF
jgi:hypothetical protein